MVAFRKAKAEQAALKLGLYGPPGSGKTFTALLVAEGLAKRCGKRIAYVDTERGTDFYCQEVPNRKVHPQAFDFDAIYTKSIMEILGAVKSLSPDEYGVLVLDSVTHMWEACIAAYAGKTTSIGSIPMHAWGKIKKPYRDLMSAILSSPLHVIICGRQGTEYATDADTDELKAIGLKMKAEGETPYEPHILIRMESVRGKKPTDPATIYAYAEKDRTGILSGKTFANPTFESLCSSILPLLGGVQAKVATLDETASIDAEAMAVQADEKAALSSELLTDYRARITLAKSLDQLKAIGKELTPKRKSEMTTADVASLREAYLQRETVLKGGTPVVVEPELEEVA